MRTVTSIPPEFVYAVSKRRGRPSNAEKQRRYREHQKARAVATARAKGKQAP
jgi:hypothetical protein